MPDVSRSDSQRSDTSASKPRVSFNRDVHVKRIVSRDTPPVSGALSGDGAGHLVALPVHKERLRGRSKKQLAEEAAKIIHQADKVDCTTNQDNKPPEKFYTLPTRKKHRKNSESPHSSHERLNTRRRSEELGVTTGTPPKKPPRTFTHSTPIKSPKQKNLLFKLFTKTEKDLEPKKSNLRRSISDASNLKSKTFEKPNRKRSGSESEDNPNNSATKKTQLSPIIEVSTPRDDYFSQKRDYFSNKENLDDFVLEKNEINLSSKPPRKKWNKSNTSEFTKGFLNEKKNSPEIVIIDVEKAESISDNKKKKLTSNSFKNKFKSLLNKKETSKSSDHKKKQIVENNIIVDEGIDEVDNIVEDLKIETDIIHPPEAKTSPKIQETIKILEESLEKPTDMIHSSQKPAEKIPLTRGHTVDTMIKRLSRDKYSPPPKTNTILVTPTVTVAHNNNQPFSYIQPRGISPERYSRSKSPERPYSRSKSPERPYSRARSPLFDKPSSPIIYAQVVCGNGDSDGLGSNKKTIHTAYANNKSKFQHSDSDEGLGYEENSGLNSRKYTQFGDEKKYDVEKYIEKFDDEYPITPKFKSFGSNGYDNYEYSKTEHHTSFVDSSVRGRGDGMDSRRRESLTEPLIENGITNKYNDHNGKSDLSYRRDLLESRINSRRLGDKIISNNSPELYTPRVNKYVSETTSRYYRHGSSSPVGFTDNYRSETKSDRHGEKYITESRSRTVENDRNGRNLDYNNRYDRFESEPKSLESQVSDYRSSPENGSTNRKYFTSHETKEYRTHSKYKPKPEKLSKDRDHYKSNPEIINRNYDSYKYDQDNRYVSETYHDSLKRQKHESRSREDLKHSEKYFDDRDRKDKFGDSGIENDFRRDSGENVRVTRTYTQTYRSNNESEDEGFASSLLIASERQHTEDNFNKKFKNYDSDKEMRRNDLKKSKHDYVHRERSIDDGSHYDPRIDKDLDNKKGSLKMEKKPPKPAKMSSLKKVKQLFTRDPSKKKKDKVEMVKEETLRARYKEYRGSNEAVNRSTLKRDNHVDYKRDYNSDSRIDNNSDNSQGYDYSNRRRLSTPSPSPTRETAHNVQSGKQNDGWFKSLDRFSLKKNKATKLDSKENLKEASPKPAPAQQTKNLRFFGDTDLESDTSVRRKSSLKSRPNIPNYKSPATATKTRSQSSRNLHNISEEFNNSDTDTLRKYKSHKSMQNISESDRDIKGSKSNLKPPISPNRRTETLKKNTDMRNRKRRNEMSSVESSTEGDSSQQSQRSVVYLHAATVGDIPGPGYLARNGRRAASKEDLISNGSSRMQTQVKTLSRSFSVLAPWKPRYAHEGIEVDYSQQNQQNRPARNIRNGSSKSGGKTAKEISNQKKMSNQNLSTLNRKSKSKENISNTLNRRNKDDISSKSSNTTLYKKKERLPKDNMRYSRDEKKISSKSMSVESLGGGSRSSVRSKEDPRNISRSISMPRDPEKSAGWFNKINKKSNSKKTLSSQRL